MRIPTASDAYAIKFLMLWPDDAETRERAMNAALREIGERFIGDMDIETARWYARLAKTGPVLADVLSEIGDRVWHGSFAGRIALEAIVLNNAGQTTSLETIRRKLADDMKVQKRDAGGYQIEPQTLANTSGPIAKFRPVAHLWAAHIWNRIHGQKTFPCTVRELPSFHGLAEAICDLGEATKLRHSKGTIFKPEEMYRWPWDGAPKQVFRFSSNTETTS